MPTENRSSNTEQMVSAPRSLLEEACNGLRITQDRARKELRALLAQPADQHQGDPDRALKDALFACLAAGGEDREYGGVATAGDRQGWVRFTTVAACAQQQGEPVAQVVSKYGDPEAFGEREIQVLADISSIPYDTKLYTHPDAGEVERLREKIKQLRTALHGAQERWGKLETALLAQLTERDALLREAHDLVNSGNIAAKNPHSWETAISLRDRIKSLLSTSAEPNQCDGCQAGIPLINGAHRMGKPGGYADTMSCQAGKYAIAESSAPVERDEREAFQREGRYIVIKLVDLAKVPSAVGEPFAEQLTAIQRRLPSRQYVVVESDWPEYEPTWAAIQARAALERKP